MVRLGVRQTVDMRCSVTFRDEGHPGIRSPRPRETTIEKQVLCREIEDYSGRNRYILRKEIPYTACPIE